MIEVTVSEYLRKKLAPVKVVMETPKKLPKDFVQITTLDREQVNYIESVTLRIGSYATSKAKAAELDEMVRKAMKEIVELNDISSSRLTGGGDEPDASIEMYRYRSYYNLTY